jgi:hypothetical protein
LGRFIERDPWRAMARDEGLLYRPYSVDGYPSLAMNSYASPFVPNTTDPTGMYPGCDWGDCDYANACRLGGCFPGECGWDYTLGGARLCRCKPNWRRAAKVATAVCVCGAVVVGTVALGVMCPPAAPAAAAAACAVMGATVGSIQLTPPTPSQGSSCLQQCPGEI